MNKILNYQEYWRMAFILVIIVSVFFPWMYDQVYVPAGQLCAPPFVRLDADVCGFPFNGIMYFFAAPIVILVPLLPIVTSLLVLHDEFSRPRLFIHLAVLLLALLPGISMLAAYSARLILGGSLLFSGAAAVALILELLAFIWQQRTTRQALAY
jgi:hypothetical protein